MRRAPYSTIALFDGIEPEDIDAMLPCLGARERSYVKGETIFRTGDTTGDVGIVLAGGVNITVNYAWGSTEIFAHVEPGQMFGEAYAITGGKLLVDAVAAEDSTVLFLRANKLMATCGHACPHHVRTIQNLIRIAALKNAALSRRMMHTAPKTIRERALSYLAEQEMEHGSRSFTIPFSREEMANYLSVDRSALSNELSKMQRDGLIRFRKNRFELL